VLLLKDQGKQDPALAAEVGDRWAKLFEKYPGVGNERPILEMLAGAGVAVPFASVEASLARFEDFKAERTSENEAFTKARLDAFSLIAGVNVRLPLPRSTRDRSFSERIVKVSENHRMYDEQYLQKLANNFLRENAPFPSPAEAKWSFSTRFDQFGRKIFLRLNHSFNTHAEALSGRDLGLRVFTGGQEMSRSQREMDERELSWRFVSSEGLTFVATLINLHGRYMGMLSVAYDSIAYFGMKMWNVFGDEFPTDQRNHKLVTIPFSGVAFIFNRIINGQDHGCEIYLTKHKSYLFEMDTVERRTGFYRAIGKGEPIVTHEGYNFFRKCRKACNALCQNIPTAELVAKTRITRDWSQRRISTYEYLIYLNILASRSFNNISQYPIFPWVLNSFDVATVNLDDPTFYRDFSLCLGAIRPEREQANLQPDSGMPECGDLSLSRLHYSSPAAVVNFHLRLEPFTSLHVLLHGGKFAPADLLFSSLASTWRAISENLNDSCELTPEFYMNSEFFENMNGLDLGYLPDGSVSGDCVLPRWARSWHEFVGIHRQALESEIVRLGLPDWLDLVFGCQRRSVEKDSLFPPFASPEDLSDSREREAALRYIRSVGSFPARLFDKPHKKSDPGRPSPGRFEFPFPLDPRKVQLFARGVCVNDDGELFHCLSSTRDQVDPAIARSAVLYLGRAHEFVCLHGRGAFASVGSAGFIAHQSSHIQCIAQVDEDTVATGGSDCLVYLWRVPACRLLGAIPVAASAIVDIDGSGPMGVVAVATDAHRIVLCWTADAKPFFSFPVACDGHATHRVRLLASGAVAVTCEVPGAFRVLLYSARGVGLGEVAGDGAIRRIVKVETLAGECFLAVALASGEVRVIDTTACEVCAVLEHRAAEGLIAAVDNTRGLLMVVADGEDRKVVVETFPGSRVSGERRGAVAEQ
jgi:hypothetical protein